MAAVAGFWQPLFGAGAAQGVQVPLRVLRKQGRPFLALPAGRSLAAATLDLYPAQTGRARLARGLLRCLLRAGAPVGTERVSLVLPGDDGLVKFLGAQAGVAPRVPEFGILAGNPATPGQRFLLLVFDSSQRPAAVVKAGLSAEAKALIRREQAFLEAIGGKAVGVPKLRGALQTATVEALALNYFGGRTPRPRDDGGLAALLRGWVDAERAATLSEIPAWQRLERAAAADPLWPALAGCLRARSLRPVLGHGDLAPWNIKVSPQGDWTALDWERGELTGVAGWDWFHYVLQRAILVERLPAERLVERAARLLAAEEFKRYGEQTGIAGFARELLLAYLLYRMHVIQPAAGIPPTRALAKALAASWPAT